MVRKTKNKNKHMIHNKSNNKSKKHQYVHRGGGFLTKLRGAFGLENDEALVVNGLNDLVSFYNKMKEDGKYDKVPNANSKLDEIINELSAVSALYVVNKMKNYKFSDDLCKEVINNWNNLRKDLESEGVEF